MANVNSVKRILLSDGELIKYGYSVVPASLKSIYKDVTVILMVRRILNILSSSFKQTL